MTADKSCTTCAHANSDMICVNLDSEQCGQEIFERDSCEEWKGEGMNCNYCENKCDTCVHTHCEVIIGIQYRRDCLSNNRIKWEPHSNYCHFCGEPLTEPVPLSLEQLREMDGQPVWLDKCYIVNNNYKSPQGWTEPCGVDMWGQGTSLSLIARCGCYDRPPKERMPCTT